MQWSLEERFDAIQSRAFRCHEISRERIDHFIFLYTNICCSILRRQWRTVERTDYAALASYVLVGFVTNLTIPCVTLPF